MNLPERPLALKAATRKSDTGKVTENVCALAVPSPISGEIPLCSATAVTDTEINQISELEHR
jgi:hypothetical protein